MKLLFVCTGNICRSPMAEGIARAVISGKYAQSPVEVEIDSAGIAGLDGHGPTPEASMAMEERGIDIGGYRGQTVTRGLVESSDLVLVMEERQRAHASALAGNDAVPVFMLLKLAEAARVVLRARDHGLEGDGPFESLQSVMSVAAVMERNGSWELPSHQYEVSDPVGMPLEWYRKAADIMEAAIGDIVEALLSKSASST